MNDSPENRPKPLASQVDMPCPTPDEWEAMLGPESIMQSFDGRFDAHVEHCSKCRAYLEQRSAAHPGLSLISLAGSLAQPPAPLPVSMAGIAVPVGYLAIGAPVYGGRGLVFKALHLASGRHVAIKMSKFRHDGNETERHALEREARTVASLAHPNIVQIYQVLADSESPAIVMEWVEGGTLLDLLKNRRPSIAEIVHLMKQLADAVDHAHQHLVLHRDIKPSNILMAGGDFNQAKLSDFGLAKLGQADEGWSTATEFIGTPVYMAPESFRKETGKIGPTVDIYSLGAVLYRLLSGKVPFEGANPIELGMRVVQEEVTPIRQFQKAVPKDLETICLKCLRKEPEERYPDAAALKADLVRFEEGKPVRASRDGTITRWRRWVRRDPRAARQAAAFGIFLIGVIIALASLLQRSRGSERFAQQKLLESNQAIGLASPIFKRILVETKLKPDEHDKIKKFIKLRENIDYEPIDLRDRLDHHYLTLELADSLRKLPGEIENSIEQAKLARQKIGQLINEHGDEAHRLIYGGNKDGTYKETVLERALIQYSNACSQLYGTYARGKRNGLGSPAAPEDPEQLLVKEAIAASERMMKLNPNATEPIGQVAHYYLHLAEVAIEKGNKDQAIDYLLQSTRFTQELRVLYSGAKERWTDESRVRQYLAQVYLEKPADLDKYLKTINTLSNLMEQAELSNNQFRSEILMDIWSNLLINYKVLAGFGEYSKALAAADHSLATFPHEGIGSPHGSTSNREWHLVNIDRLSLLKLLNTAPEELAKAENQVEMMIGRIDNADEKAFVYANFELFRLDPKKRSPKKALQWLRQVKDQTDSSIMQAFCEILLGQAEISQSLDSAEVFAKKRCFGRFAPFQIIIFEVEALLNQGVHEGIAPRMKLIEAWLENDKLAPCFLRLRVEELRRRLIH